MREQQQEGPIAGGPLSVETGGRLRRTLSSVSTRVGRAAVGGLFFASAAGGVVYAAAPIITERYVGLASKLAEEESKERDFSKPQIAKMKKNLEDEQILPILAEKFQNETDGMSFTDFYSCLSTPEKVDPLACVNDKLDENTDSPGPFVTEADISVFQSRIEDGTFESMEVRDYTEIELRQLFFGPQQAAAEPAN